MPAIYLRFAFFVYEITFLFAIGIELKQISMVVHPFRRVFFVRVFATVAFMRPSKLNVLMDNMRMRRLAPKTQANYLRAVRDLTIFRMETGGSHAGRVSSFQCACSRVCSGNASSQNSRPTYRRGQLRFFGEYVHLNDVAAFTKWLASMRAWKRVVLAKRPFAGPKAVLAYLSRYTHRVADLQPTSGGARRTWRHLALEGLSRQQTHMQQNYNTRTQ